MNNIMCKTSRAFTIIELLVVIAIIGVLFALLLPAVQMVRESARKVSCGNQLRQFATALENYASARGTLPTGACNRNPNASNPVSLTDLKTPDTWFAEILPFREQIALHDRFDFSLGTGSPVNVELVATEMPGVRCPSDDSSTSVCQHRCHWFSYPTASRMVGLWYAASSGNSPLWRQCSFCSPPYPAESNSRCCAGADRGGDGKPSGAFGLAHQRLKFAELSDGLSKTILLGETLPRGNSHNGAYTGHYPIIATNIPINTFVPLDMWPGGSQHQVNYGEASGIKSMHPHGAFVAYCDGSIHFLNESIAFDTLLDLGSRQGGEVVGSSVD
jgi:prepilin-type N-terminal cleavage/methylation domain-containing protein